MPKKSCDSKKIVSSVAGLTGPAHGITKSSDSDASSFNVISRRLAEELHNMKSEVTRLKRLVETTEEARFKERFVVSMRTREVVDLKQELIRKNITIGRLTKENNELIRKSNEEDGQDLQKVVDSLMKNVDGLEGQLSKTRGENEALAVEKQTLKRELLLAIGAVRNQQDDIKRLKNQLKGQEHKGEKENASIIAKLEVLLAMSSVSLQELKCAVGDPLNQEDDMAIDEFYNNLDFDEEVIQDLKRMGFDFD
uniref:UBA domain-containing protein n=1 Tax=Caenorhabditis japonica TaxID=281687 RepID=A0A8R1IRS3_CAEJA